MQFNYFFLLLFQIFLSLNAQAYTCLNTTDPTPIRIGTIGTINLNEVSLDNTIFTDKQDVELWIAKCVDDLFERYILVATVTPTVAGLSRNSLYSIIIIQNNQQFEDLFYSSENLFIPSDFTQNFATTIFIEGTVNSTPPNLRLDEPFSLIFTCHSSLVGVLPCVSINPTVTFQVNFHDVVYSNGF